MNPNTGANPLLVLEEAIHLLRKATVVNLALYYVGAVPFVLAMLFFLAEMSTSPFAYAQCAPYAVGLSLLYLWMRCWQAVFCSRLRAQLAGAPPLRWNRGAVLRLLLLQTAWATYGCVMVPVGMVLVLPLGWVYAFHQNMTSMHLARVCREPDFTVWGTYHRAKRLAVLWPLQNHLSLLIVSICRLFVWIGVVSTIVLIPVLGKSLFGISSVFTQSYWWTMNTTFFAVTFGITYLCFDPVIKAFYVLRCFYGRSLRTGDDVRVGLRRARRRREALAAAALVLVLVTIPLAARADETPRDLAWPMDDAVERHTDQALDASISEVMTRNIYTWRMPRDLLPPPEDEGNVFVRFADSITEFIQKSIRWLRDGIDAIIRRIFLGEDSGNQGMGMTLGAGLRLVTLLGSVLMLGLLLRVLLAGGRTQRAALEETGVLPAIPDLEDEAVVASQLPEEEWLALARKLRAEGEVRKAIRAYFLAGLACLGRVEAVRIARFKSNREYQRELHRRAQRYPGIEPVFSDNVSRFERIWYGLYEVDRDALDALEQNVQRMKRLVHPTV